MSPRKNASKSDLSPSEGFGYFFGAAYASATSWGVYRAMLVFMVALTVICSRIALFNILAYEFTAFVALFVAHFTAALTIRETAGIRPIIAQRSPFTPGPHPRLVIWGVVLGSLAASGWLLLLPLIGIVLLDLVFSIRNCDPLTGLGLYISNPPVSAFFSAVLGVLCALLTNRRRCAGWLYAFVVLVFSVRVILRFGLGHVIGIHDPFVGIINLPLYDQEANLERGFVFSRLFLVVISTFLMSVSILLADRRFQRYSLRNLLSNLPRPDAHLPEIGGVIVLGALIVLGFYYQGPLGMEITRRYLEHVLNGRVVTEHYIIRYPRGSEIEEDIERVAEEHEYYWSSIVNEIGVAPDRRIRAYIYPSRDQKTFLTGVGAGVYAKPWTSEIHVEYDRNRIRALKHELVHVISAPMGVPFFGSSMLGAYGEGIAEGVQWETGNDLTYHQWAAALRSATDPQTSAPFFPRETAPLELLTRNLRPGGFYVGRLGMNYYLGASHTRWFLDTYGAEAFAAAYVRDDTFRAIGRSQADTAQAWMQYLDHVPLTEEEIAFAGLAFSPPKFVAVPCAHEVAEHERLAEERMKRRAWPEAFEEYRILLDFSPENIRYGYKLAQLLYYMDRYEEALQQINAMRGWGSAAGWECYLLLLQGDIFTRSGQVNEAARAYQSALDSALVNSVRESAALRLKILDSPARDEFLAGLRDPEDARWRYERARGLDETWLPLYYLGADLVADRMYSEAQETLLECLRLNPEYPFVQRDCLFYLGICAYRGGEYTLARQNFRDASGIAGDIFMRGHPAYDGFIPLNRLDAWTASCDDWVARCDWRETWTGLTTNQDSSDSSENQPPAAE